MQILTLLKIRVIDWLSLIHLIKKEFMKNIIFVYNKKGKEHISNCGSSKWFVRTQTMPEPRSVSLPAEIRSGNLECTQAKWQLTFLLLLLFACFNNSCKKPDYVQSNKGNNSLMLSAAKTSFVLNQSEDANDAVHFTWTSGSNHGTNASIYYTLIIDKQGNNFSNPVIEELGSGTFEKKFTVKDLNNLLLTRWNFPANTEAVLEAKIIAKVSDNAAPADSSNVLVFKVTPYMPVTATLYLIGDATPNGWDNNLATPLTASATTPGEFTWDGYLTSGTLKFITTLGQFLPSYNKGANDSTLVYRDDNAQPDDQFVIPDPVIIQLNLIC